MEVHTKRFQRLVRRLLLKVLSILTLLGGTIGAPVVMGAAPLSYRDSYTGRMPVFHYLSQEEAADAYFYLTLYPPHE